MLIVIIIFSLFVDILQPKVEELAQTAKPDDIKSVSSVQSVEVEAGEVKEEQLAVDVAE